MPAGRRRRGGHRAAPGARLRAARRRPAPRAARRSSSRTAPGAGPRAAGDQRHRRRRASPGRSRSRGSPSPAAGRRPPARPADSSPSTTASRRGSRGRPCAPDGAAERDLQLALLRRAGLGQARQHQLDLAARSSGRRRPARRWSPGPPSGCRPGPARLSRWRAVRASRRPSTSSRATVRMRPRSVARPRDLDLRAAQAQQQASAGRPGRPRRTARRGTGRPAASGPSRLTARTAPSPPSTVRLLRMSSTWGSGTVSRSRPPPRPWPGSRR